MQAESLCLPPRDDTVRHAMSATGGGLSPETGCLLPDGSAPLPRTPAPRLAQVCIEPNRGRLTGVEFWNRDRSLNTTGMYKVRLNTVDPGTGAPKLTTLAQAQRTTDSVSDTELKPVRFTFPTPPMLQPGKRYALILMMIDATNDGWEVERRPGNPCPGATPFSANPPGPFFSQSAGLPFRTFVTP